MNPADEIAHVLEAAVLHPGDALVVSFSQPLTPAEFDRATEAMKRALPDTIKVLAIGGEVRLYVLRSGEVTE